MDIYTVNINIDDTKDRVLVCYKCNKELDIIDADELMDGSYKFQCSCGYEFIEELENDNL